MRPKLAVIVCLSFLFLSVAAVTLAAPAHQQATPVPVTVASQANLRAGPATTYTVIGSASVGETLMILGCNADCSWYKTASGAWIAGFLLTKPPSKLSLMAPATTAPLPAVILPTPTPKPTRRLTTRPADTPAVTALATAIVSSAQPRAAGAANLRVGPGISYEPRDIVNQGAPLTIVSQTEAGDWYRLDNGLWIATFLVENAADTYPVAQDIPALTMATAEPPVPASAPVAPPPTDSSGLQVEFVNPHYDCVQGEQTYRTGERFWGYRRFQVDMFIMNQGTQPVTPPWQPNRWIITDGSTVVISDIMWQWIAGYRGATLYPQPAIPPGGVQGWTFMAFPLDRNQWVKAVEYEHEAQVFRVEFSLGSLRNAYNYADCGEPRPHEFYPTPTPHPENLPQQ